MAVAGTAGIELVTLPILLTAYYEFSILSIAANVLFLPFMGGILVTSLAGIGLGSITILQENSALDLHIFVLCYLSGLEICL